MDQALRDNQLKLNEIEKELNQKFFERQDVIRGLLVGLIAKQHVVLLGPPGEGKTDLTTELCSRIGGEFFHWLMGRTTTPDEIFGPVSVKKYLEQESYEHSTQGKLPNAHVAFQDEIFKSNTAVLNLLLDIMENNRFHNGKTPQTVPLHMMVGASNEMPEEGEGLEAIWDRFSLRYVIKPIQSKKNFLQMIENVDYKKITSGNKTIITLIELENIQAEARQVIFGKPGQDLLGKVWDAMRDLGYAISDRKYVRAVGLMKAHAYIEGRTAVEESDLAILAHSFWNEEEQRLKIAKTLIQMANPLEIEARELLDAAIEIHTAMTSAPSERKITVTQEANAKLVKAKNRLEELIKEAERTGKSIVKIQDAFNQVDEMNKQAVNILLGW